jgi:mRNA-degrading endonuclease RelE of RelBE toxin-antitoxin system
MISRQKYWAKSVVIDGIKFSSQLEARFYKYFIEKGIEIAELQPRFLLQDKVTVRGENLRKIEYVADFRIVYEWDEYIVDAKWMRLAVFDLKIKLWKKRYWHETNLIVAKSIKELEKFLTNQ